MRLSKYLVGRTPDEMGYLGQNILVKVAPMKVLQLAVRDRDALDQLFGVMVDIILELTNRMVVAERGRLRAPHCHSFPRLHPQWKTLLW